MIVQLEVNYMCALICKNDGFYFNHLRKLSNLKLLQMD